MHILKVPGKLSFGGSSDFDPIRAEFEEQRIQPGGRFGLNRRGERRPDTDPRREQEQQQEALRLHFSSVPGIVPLSNRLSMAIGVLERISSSETRGRSDTRYR